MFTDMTDSTAQAGSYPRPPLPCGMDDFETWQRIGWHRTTMTDFQNAALELGDWLEDGRGVLDLVSVLWCAGELEAATSVWSLACARAEVVVRDDVEAEAALDAVERALYGLSPLVGG